MNEHLQIDYGSLLICVSATGRLLTYPHLDAILQTFPLHVLRFQNGEAPTEKNKDRIYLIYNVRKEQKRTVRP